MDFKQFLLEMIVHKESEQPEYVVAFRGDIWLLDDNSDFEKIKASITANHNKLQNHPSNREMDDYYDLEGWIKDVVPDAIAGSIRNKKLYLAIDPESNYAVTSPLIKKVVNTLKLRSVSYSVSIPLSDGNEKDLEIKKKDIKGNFPDFAYHGTSGKNILSLLKFGIAPLSNIHGDVINRNVKSNFPQIISHGDLIFLTSNLNKAEWHAEISSHNQKGHPIILQVKIPDKSLIVPDFDVDSRSDRTNYQHKPDIFSAVYSVNSLKASKHSGIFGYKGRIPASFIMSVLIYNKRLNKWVSAKPDRVMKLYQTWDSDMWYRFGSED